MNKLKTMILIHVLKKIRFLEAWDVHVQLESRSEDDPPMIVVRIEDGKGKPTFVLLPPEEASKLANGLLEDDVKRFLKLSEEKKDVMFG